MPAERISRDKDTREATTRERPWRPPGAFPDNIQPEPGYKLHWVRTHYNGAEEDKGQLYKRMQSGWRPVKAEEVPDLEYLKDPLTGNISLSGMVLCKNSVENTRKAVQYYTDQANGNLEGAASEFEQSQDPRMPKFSEGNYRSRIIRSY